MAAVRRVVRRRCGWSTLVDLTVSHDAAQVYAPLVSDAKGGGALCAGNAVALLVFGPVMP